MAVKEGAYTGDVHGHDQDEEKQFSLVFWIRIEVVGLLVLITIVWGLLTLPTVFYHIPVIVKSLSIE